MPSVFDGANILVTGGTGSFGHAFVRLVLSKYKPRRLAVFSRDELKQYQMAREFPEARHECIRFFIGDVRDEARLRRAFAGMDYVIHAAALKQVDTAEYNPFEAIKTNVLGAQNIVDAAIDAKVKKVVVLSSDKAVNPINLYGATKLCSDKLFIAANAYSGAAGTRFCIVRYGNVVGSRGSVVPAFRAAAARGVIPITDRRMTRFWITLRQAAGFVLEAFETLEGGEVLVPKLPSMRIVDLAETIAPGCPVKDVGIRPGEKLHEVMIPADEAAYTLELAGHYVIQPQFPSWVHRLPRPEGARPVPDRFSYASDTNDRWLTAAEMTAILAEEDRQEAERAAAAKAEGGGR